MSSLDMVKPSQPSTCAQAASDPTRTASGEWGDVTMFEIKLSTWTLGQQRYWEHMSREKLTLDEGRSHVLGQIGQERILVKVYVKVEKPI